MRRRKRMMEELDEDIREHIARETQDNIARGMSAEEARRAALLKFGNVTKVEEETRELWSFVLLEQLLQDLRFSFRMLRKAPGFTGVAVLTLALGIGANTAIFSVVNSVLLKPLPYPNASRIVMIFLNDASLGITRGNLGNADFLALRQEQRSFTAVAALSSPHGGFTLTGAGDAVEIPGTAVTPEFFSVLGEEPMLGRTFLANEGQPDQTKTVVASYQFWKQRLGADPAAIGRSITLNQASYTVIGVMPPDFHFGQFGTDELWPILQVPDIHRRPPYNLLVVAALKPDVSIAAASADETRISSDVSRQYPLSGQKNGNVVTMKDFMVGNTGTALLVVLGAVGLVLLIAVVNVANLQIARAAARQREMAIRTALGAAWPRLARQLLTESILLGTIGAALGLWLAHRGLLAILALSPDLLPRMNEVAVNGSVLAFTAVVALIASILSGLAPALGTRTSHLDEWLKQGGRSDTSGASSRLIHNILVVLEFSLALVLLTGAGLLLRSLSRLEAVSPGFEPAHILTAQISLPPMRYASAEQVTSFYRQLLNEISGTPGVTSAGLTMSLPPNLLEVMNPFHLEGQPYTLDKAVSLAEEIPISDNYFRALGTPLIAGRFFDDEDRTPGRHSMIVNLTMAQNYFSSRAVGQELQTGDANPQSTWYTIVGVVGDVKYQGLAAKDQPTMYVPTYDDGWNPWFTRSMSLVVRSPENPDHLASALRESVASLDRDVPLSKIQTMDDLMSQSVGEPRFWTVLLATFAVLALVLAAIGIYGVTSYSVTRRTHEIGIMIALGAQPNDVLKVILSQGARLALFGAAVGMAAAFAVTRVMSSLLFGVSATDPLTLAGVAILLVFVALLACYVPARRAMRVDPMVALRYE